MITIPLMIDEQTDSLLVCAQRRTSCQSRTQKQAQALDAIYDRVIDKFCPTGKPVKSLDWKIPGWRNRYE